MTGAHKKEEPGASGPASAHDLGGENRVTNPALSKDMIRRSTGGRLELAGRILQEGEQVRVWVDDAPAQCRVVKQSRNWLIVLSDGRATGGYGLRAELLET